MSHAMGVKCPRCQTQILPEWCPEGCAEGHGSTYTTCLACRMASGHAPVESLLTTVDDIRCINCSSPTCDGEACMESPYQPRDTGPALDPRAVEAAAKALSIDLGDPGDWYEVAATALTAAAPFLRAEGAAAERHRIAAVLDWANGGAFVASDEPVSKYANHSIYREGYAAAQRHAARIAEADPGTTAPTEGDDRD